MWITVAIVPHIAMGPINLLQIEPTPGVMVASLRAYHAVVRLPVSCQPDLDRCLPGVRLGKSDWIRLGSGGRVAQTKGRPSARLALRCAPLEAEEFRRRGNSRPCLTCRETLWATRPLDTTPIGDPIGVGFAEWVSHRMVSSTVADKFLFLSFAWRYPDTNRPWPSNRPELPRRGSSVEGSSKAMWALSRHEHAAPMAAACVQRPGSAWAWRSPARKARGESRITRRNWREK